MDKTRKYYLGLDIGTDSVGYAVTDEQYNILKFNGKPAWGVTLFDQAALCDKKREFRSARRRLDRRQQRVLLIQELFAKEIEKKDPRFFIRLKESALFRDDVQEKFILFDDEKYTDVEYYKQYPTIHHLIVDLMKADKKHDIRLVYLACSWLVAHRGHFLSNLNVYNISEIKNFETVYDRFMKSFTDNEYAEPWQCKNINRLGEIIRSQSSVTIKNKELVELLYFGKKPSKVSDDYFPYSRAAILKLLAGASCKVEELFCKEEYSELGSISLGMEEDKIVEIMAKIGDDAILINGLREIHDWALLVDVLGNYDTISESKVAIYEQHKKDLKFLKYFIKKYIPEKYDDMFRAVGKDNYVAYSYHTNDGDTSKLKKVSQEDFCKFTEKIIKSISPSDSDQEDFQEILQRLESKIFMPKQKNTNNRVIPYQLYLQELMMILDAVSKEHVFLNYKDESGITVVDKIIATFKFKIPYYVGPLNKTSKYAWLERKPGKIYPWNFSEMVDLDVSEDNFIKRMTNTCTYLPGEYVLPKDSLAYRKFMVLNEINNIRINGEKISVELKQEVYNNLFLNKKKITRKRIIEYFVSNNYIEVGEENLVTGIDDIVKSNLSTQIAFRTILEEGIVKENDVEKIILRASYAEDKSRLEKWLIVHYPHISEKDRKYISNLKISDFGRLSYRFLCEIEGVCKETGEIMTIMSALWNYNDNLMELLSDRYTFKDVIEAFSIEYYHEHSYTLTNRLDEMYISNAVRRPIFRTLDIVKDVKKAFRTAPEKIFVETTRGGMPEQKAKRTKNRKDQILDLYKLCDEEEVRILRKQLEDLGELADNKLQSDKLFLYFMQLGKSMYSDTTIDLNQLGSRLYDIDHIYPQALVKDDSIINNKVLVLSEENGKKKDIYPISSDIRHKRAGYWYYLKEVGLISLEKYKRLVRQTPFTEDEKWGFINRQLTETSQATKAVATLLKEYFPDAEIVYSKARNVSDFRHEFDIYKSRLFNDLHHAVDAYLNIVVGNVYHMKFSKRWFSVHSKYSMKTSTIFTHSLICGNETIWDGEKMLQKVKENAKKSNAHITRYAFFKRGGLFDQMPVPATDGLVPRKKNLQTEKYGGYNKSSVMFFIPTLYKLGKKQDIMILSVEMLYGNQFLEDSDFAKEYAFTRLNHILGKQVDEVSFPMGMRPWKVNTVLSFDGFRGCIAGIGSGGKTLIVQSLMQFSDNSYWQFYLKKLENMVTKIKNNPNYVYDEEYDVVNKERNIELYNIYIKKYSDTIYRKRVNSPLQILIDGKDIFVKLSVIDQARALLNIHQTFGKVSGGCDLTLIGGKARAAATVNFSSKVSNWRKYYEEVRIIDSTASGLWEKQSTNILELL